MQAMAPQLHYATPAGRWVLVATVLGSGIVGLDATVVGIALPAIGRDFGIDVAGLQWVVNAYTLTLAGLLLLGGTLGDRYGRRRVFVVGTVWFAVASLLCGVAPDGTTLILARALQGVAASLLAPGSLAILEASFTERDRPRAIGAWSGLGGVATAVGPFLGGLLISLVSWRLVFILTLPLPIAVVLVSARHVPESRAPATTGRLDLTGAFLVTARQGGLAHAPIEGADRGWPPPARVTALVAGVVLLAAFLLVEGRTAHPMLPLEVFASRQFS